jgi:putative membrane protein
MAEDRAMRLVSTSFSFMLAIILLNVAAPVLAQGDGDRYFGHHMWDGGWWMLLGPVWMIVVVGATVAAVVLVVRWLGGTERHPRGPDKTPMDILKERFARGEIDKQEFEERRSFLK